MKYLSIILLSIFAISCSSAKKKAGEEANKAEAKVDQKVKEAQPAAKSAAQKANAGSAIGEFPMITGDIRSEANCAAGSDKRKVSVIDRKAEKDCGVVYEKFGVAKTVAMASSDMSFCDKVAENIKGNLNAGGITCDGAAAK